MTSSFKGKAAIVTGAGQGIGFEICRQLAEAGASVVLNDVDEKLCTAASASITKDTKGTCVAFPCDCADELFIDALLAKAVAEFGHIDVVVANAGITLFGSFLDYPATSFQRVMHVNLAGTFFLAQRAARQMILQNTGGAMLFMSSVTGHQAHKDLAAYSMTKAAIEMLARNLVIELSPHRIRVNTIAPGATLTERTLNDPSYADTWSRLTPLGAAASTKDIAHAALFLVSDQAAHITGQSLVVDGGWSAISPSP